MSTLNKLGSNYGTASSRSCAITSRKTRNAPVDFQGVALMEKYSIVQLSNVISLQVLLVITAYHLCLHTWIALLCQKSNSDRTFVRYQIVGSCFIPTPTIECISNHKTIRMHFMGKYAFYRWYTMMKLFIKCPFTPVAPQPPSHSSPLYRNKKENKQINAWLIWMCKHNTHTHWWYASSMVQWTNNSLDS